MKKKRGTCPYCERRIRVLAPRGGRGQECATHDAPLSSQAVRKLKTCPGSGMVCQEDRGQPKQT